MYREEAADPATRISTGLATSLAPLGFVSKPIVERFELARLGAWTTQSSGTDIIDVKGSWAHKTWNVNRSVVHLGVPENCKDLNGLSHRMEGLLAEPLGYLYWLKPVALFLVWSGVGLWDSTRNVGEGLDYADMQRGRWGIERNTNLGDPRANLMAISAIDLAAKRVTHQAHPRLTTAKSTAAAIQACLVGLVGPTTE